MTDVLLVPGLWLDGTCWDDVTPRLAEAGHTPVPVTLPGMEAGATGRGDIGLEDHVAAVVAAVDDAEDGVVLVGHSAACAVVWAAADRRPERVARVVCIGGFPTPDGEAPADYFTPVDGEVPLPDWSDLDDADVADFDDATRADFHERAIPSPARVTSDAQQLSDERRFDVPVTVVCPEFSAEQLQGWVDGGAEPVAELARIRDVTYVDIDTGHWPQLTQPTVLADALLDVLGG